MEKIDKPFVVSETDPIRTLSISFNLPIFSRQIAQWRGAFIELAGWTEDLFHNHDNAEGGYHYRYPLVQYRVYKGNAAVFAINEAVEALQGVLALTDWKIQWEGKPHTLQIEDIRMEEHYLRMLARPKEYNLFKWLALNQENYEKWQQSKNLVERSALLENVLTGHILGFCTAMDWRLPERLEVNLQQVQFMQKVRCFGNSMVAFNVAYDANVLLPTRIGLGRAVSHGFGWQVPARLKRQKPFVEKKEESTSEAAEQ